MTHLGHRLPLVSVHRAAFTPSDRDERPVSRFHSLGSFRWNKTLLINPRAHQRRRGVKQRQWTLVLLPTTAAGLFLEGSDSIVQISHCGLSFSLAIGPLSERTKSMPVTFKRRCRTHWLLGIIELDHIIRNQNTQQNYSAIERLVLPGRNSSYFPVSRWSSFQSNCLSNCFLALFGGKSDCWQHTGQVAISTTAFETGRNSLKDPSLFHQHPKALDLVKDDWGKQWFSFMKLDNCAMLSSLYFLSEINPTLLLDKSVHIRISS